MKRFFLKHTTTYNYSNFVYESSNKLHLYPYNDLNQQIVSHKINIPGNPLVDSYIDDYNNRVGFFTYTPPHRFLRITSEAEIIKKRIIMPEDTMDVDEQWKILKKLKLSFDFIPFLKFQNTSINKELFKVIESCKFKSASPMDVADNLCEYVNKNFNYKKGVTNVFTKIDEVWYLKTGVCQDFTNILIQLCRIAEIPTRYVSGYVFAAGRFRGASATHAWVEVYIPNYGWLGLDPTNNCIADIYHIRLAVGRNYGDCSPVKGVYKGNETQIMKVNVVLDTKKIKSKDEVIFENSSSSTLNKEEDNSSNSFQKHLQMMQQQQ